LTHQTRGINSFKHPHVFLETKGSDFLVANFCYFAKNILLQIPFFFEKSSKNEIVFKTLTQLLTI
jgi:hypothetical protein